MAAAASVDFLLSKLKQLLITDGVHLVGKARDEIEQLIDNELLTIMAILEGASLMYKKGETCVEWEREIRKVMYDIEDTVDTCVAHMASKKAKKKNLFRRLFDAKPTSLYEAVKALRRSKVQPMLRQVDFSKFRIPDEPDTTAAEAMETRKKMTQKIVGFEGEAEELINFLSSESSKLEIASIVGMAGLGKTTLALKCFEDPDIQFGFPVRIWLNVSDVVNMKIILLTILRHFTTNISEEPVEELLTKVRTYLSDVKFLIVMDDVGTLDVWEKIKEVLPFKNSNGRVLVTTRHWDVAEHSSTRQPRYLRFLTASESWELLQYEVFGNINIESYDLKGVGKVIAKYCDGLPLSLVVIGGILREKTSCAGDHILVRNRIWEDVSTSVKPYLVDGDKNKLLLSTISLSYEKIPYELRNCFLYLGVFPEDADISVKELLRLWIAEGFILESPRKSLELVALDNLKELINCNLVLVKEKNFDGEPKILQIHDSVREICKSEAKFENLNLFQEINSYRDGFERRNSMEKFRRLCIHSHVLDFMKKAYKVPKARSFLSFDRTSRILKPADMACVTDGFVLLRVYNAKNLKFPEFPQKLVQLLHLRYLTLVVNNCTSLPEVISKLWNLQTLILDVSSRTLDIKADIWKMRQLRHLKTKASITLRKDGRGDGGDNLQTLSRLSPESCTSDVFRKARNLITLGIQGDLNKLVNSECLGILDRLHKLKLVNKEPNGLTSENPLHQLPNLQVSSPNLKVLVLIGTNMDWDRMSTLSVLEYLKVVKLKENAFVGSFWETESIFHRLEQLHIETSTELVFWKAKGNPFPKLRFLLLNNCEKLVEIPSAICESLEKIHLECFTKDLASSAGEIARDKNKQNIAFKLDIAYGARSEMALFQSLTRG